MMVRPFGHGRYRVVDPTWYRSKARASFADTLATLCRESVKAQVSSMGLSGQGSKKVISTLLSVVQRFA